jgi:hypothetical protein
MKLPTITLICLLACIASAQQGVQTRAVFIVKDDMGQPVGNAAITGGFRDFSNAGSRDRFDGHTDSNGIFIAQGKAVVGVGCRVSSASYYPAQSSKNLEYKRRQDGKGYESIDHWDVEIPILLKRIRNQIPMFMKGVENPYVSAFEGVGKYCLGRTSSYDIVNGAFLPPYGKGEMSDIRFNWKMTIYSKDSDGLAWDYDTLCEISMTNVVDGICRGVPDGSESGQTGSAYFSDYNAPVDGYTNTIPFYEHVRGTKADSNDDKHYLYYFRIRTQTNALGQVTNALYGKIYGQINGRFTYYLNPTPNDRNIEFDPAKNLFGGRDRFAP